MEETGEALPTKLVYAYYMSNNQCDIIISKLPEGAYQAEGRVSSWRLYQHVPT